MNNGGQKSALFSDVLRIFSVGNAITTALSTYDGLRS